MHGSTTGRYQDDARDVNERGSTGKERTSDEEEPETK
jgi:hypothetical protein